MAMQLPPAVGHSKMLVVALAAPVAVGWTVCLTLQLPGPLPAGPPQVSKSMLKGGLMPLPEASKPWSPPSTVIATGRVAVVLTGTLPKAILEGLALAVLMPVAET